MGYSDIALYLNWFHCIYSNNSYDEFDVLLILPSLPVWLVSCSATMASEASAKVIDGKAVAKQIRDEITGEVSRMKDAIGVVPGLAVILVGDRKDSATYVRNKKKACQSVGIDLHVLKACR